MSQPGDGTGPDTGGSGGLEAEGERAARHGIVRVLLDVPLDGVFDYRLPDGMVATPGSRVLVPWGRAKRVGLVESVATSSELPPEKLRDVEAVLDATPLVDDAWWRLMRFAANYYHRALGEIALPAFPKPFRAVPARRPRGDAMDRLRARWSGARETAKRAASASGESAGTESVDANGVAASDGMEAAPVVRRPVLNAAQADALRRLEDADGFRAVLLHGVTGSGKTEVYLHWFERLLQAPGAQALLLVPEIALTPQLTRLVAERFPTEGVAVLHSGMSDAERAMHWLAAVEGRARIVVGTRLSVMTPLPRLAGLVVDEEHDPSYKQQEGAQYSARDLAVALAQQRGIQVVLGSATPSMESWAAAQRGRYLLLTLPDRARAAAPPRVRLITLPQGPAYRSGPDERVEHGLMPPALQAIEHCLGAGEQALVFLNRRGFAPVLSCGNCGWMSGCPDCSAWRVLHRTGEAGGGGAPRSRYRLVCHHCGAEGPVPRACPECGAVELSALGRGTQRIEEGLQARFPMARIGRVDRDVARRRGATQAVIDAAHAGEFDILVGTQMLAKGHDFERLTRVIVVDADGGLFAADFRAPERLFATLMQVAGRAGRTGRDSEVLVQTRWPDHPLFDALVSHDYARFAAHHLAERRESGLPPFVFQALLRAEAKTVDEALAFLSKAADTARTLAAAQPRVGPPDAPVPPVTVYDPVPMPLVRVAARERGQLLLESASRRALHGLLADWLAALEAVRTPVRWSLEVDPDEI